jgi:hypothetical protein
MGFSYRLGQLIGAVFGEDNPLAEALLQRAEQLRRQDALIQLCEKAMHRARLDPKRSPVILTDMGLISYRSPESPKIIRFSGVPTDTRWLRPFLEVTARQKMDVQVQIAILNREGETLFTEHQRIQLRGSQRIVAQHWLPLENLYTSSGRWSVPIYVNGTLFAIHQFEWVRVGGDDILDQLRTDGEINEYLQQAVRRGKFRKMSLDELLADQED